MKEDLPRDFELVDKPEIVNEPSTQVRIDENLQKDKPQEVHLGALTPDKVEAPNPQDSASGETNKAVSNQSASHGSEFQAITATTEIKDKQDEP